MHVTGWRRHFSQALLTLSLFPALPSSLFTCFPPLRPTLWKNLKRIKLTRSKINIALHNSESCGLSHHFIYASFQCQLLRKASLSTLPKVFSPPSNPFLFLPYFIKSTDHHLRVRYICIYLLSIFLPYITPIGATWPSCRWSVNIC